MAVRTAGFTLIEMLVALSVAAVLAAAVLPSCRSLIERQRTQTALYLLSAHFASARTAAVVHRIPTSVCPSDGDGICRGDNDWSRGWLMFRNGGDKRQPATPDDVLRQEVPSLGPSLRFVSTQGRPQIRFLPNGRSGGSNITVTLCRNTQALGQVIVNNSGRIRTERPGKSQYCAGDAAPD